MCIRDRYYKTLLAIRRAFHGFYTEYLRDGLSVSAETANLHYYEHADTGTHLAFTLTNSAAGEWRKLAVAIDVYKRQIYMLDPDLLDEGQKEEILAAFEEVEMCIRDRYLMPGQNSTASPADAAYSFSAIFM